MVCGCHFLSLELSTPTGRPRSHLLVDARASKHPSLLKNRPHHTYAGEKAARIRNHRTRDNQQRRPRSHLATAPALTSIPAQECVRPSSSLVKGKAALTLAWMACTLPAAPIPAQELTQATLFPPKRRPRSHFALSPTCSDRTRIAPSPLKNLDSSRVVGNLQDGERVRLHSEHPFPLKNLDSS